MFSQFLNVLAKRNSFPSLVESHEWFWTHWVELYSAEDMADLWEINRPIG